MTLSVALYSDTAVTSRIAGNAIAIIVDGSNRPAIFEKKTLKGSWNFSRSVILRRFECSIIPSSIGLVAPDSAPNRPPLPIPSPEPFPYAQPRRRGPLAPPRNKEKSQVLPGSQFVSSRELFGPRSSRRSARRSSCRANSAPLAGSDASADRSPGGRHGRAQPPGDLAAACRAGRGMRRCSDPSGRGSARVTDWRGSRFSRGARRGAKPG